MSKSEAMEYFQYTALEIEESASGMKRSLSKTRRVSFSAETKLYERQSNTSSKKSILPQFITSRQYKIIEDDTRLYMLYIVFGLSLLIIVGIFLMNDDSPTVTQQNPLIVTQPYSTVNPLLLGLPLAYRMPASRPGLIFRAFHNKSVPLPTNVWCQNLLLGSYSQPENQVFQVPYVIDTAGISTGIRTHPVSVQGSDVSVMMIFDPDNGVELGAAEDFERIPFIADDAVHAASRLAVTIQWSAAMSPVSGFTPAMYSTIARGSPYTSMVYVNASPRIYVQRSASNIYIDGVMVAGGASSLCGAAKFSAPAFKVQREMQIVFPISDMTWIIFLSEPMEFVCSNKQFQDPNPPGPVNAVQPRLSGWQSAYPYFDMKSTKPLSKAMVRVALANNCTVGDHFTPGCADSGGARDNSEYTQLLRNHSDLYATGLADISFNFPVGTQNLDDVTLGLLFDWAPALMSQIANTPMPGAQKENPFIGSISYGTEMLMFAIPHQQQRLVSTPTSSNKVLSMGCSPMLLGLACPVIGSVWNMVEHLHRVNFTARLPPREELLDALHDSVAEDLTFELPVNYQYGAGDTYFSGKMLGRLARTLVIAEQIGDAYCDEGFCPAFATALNNLRSGVEIWLNGSANAPFLFDRDWGGLINCGCAYDGQLQRCLNKYPDCPAIADVGQNFGNGFYNDHHFHYGYHIYAAAVVMHFDQVWGRKFLQLALLYIRDIANPSPHDPYFPTWRHKDWFLGFSWANGIVTLNLNGRNQESSSEAIAAYEAVALFGHVMTETFTQFTPEDQELQATGVRIKNMGRLLYATELRSAKTYWHVQTPSPTIPRIYPAVYTPKVVGMIWSMLAQQQTWFGNAAFLSYGIQLLPITPASEDRDVPAWVREMLPIFNASCAASPGCELQGWSILVLAQMAVLGDWQGAWAGLQSLPDSVYDSAGGNGHSKTNTLWYIATRPPPDYAIQ